MYTIGNILWIKKIFLYNDKMTFMSLQLIQPKLYKHSKIKTHYDTLEVSSRATQDEIKSSYYKLSMLYHPDKNRTELAKRKFQNISEAYEVLSNHQARKRYDRSMMIIQQNVNKNKPRNIYMHTSIYKSKQHPVDNKYFNFDVWVKEHYGQSFARRKAARNEFIKEELEQSKETNEEVSYLFYIASFIVTYIMIIFATRNVNNLQPKKPIEKNK